MTPVGPFVKAARPDDGSSKKLNETQSKHQGCPMSNKETLNKQQGCPMSKENQSKQQGCPMSKVNQESKDSNVIPAKCPFGYDSQTFKIGPFSCIICQALLFESTRCVPCTHVFCKACISRFNDCPLCGADIEKTESDTNLQSVVDRFIDGHARIKRSPVDKDEKEVIDEKKNTVIYEDVSLERGAFLVQQAMRAFRANNVESAKSRLSLCAQDIREQLEIAGNTSELCSQLGAVLGMLGDCCRAMGDATSAVAYFDESVTFLSKVETDDLEVTHTLSVSLNKIGDLKYYEGDLKSARDHYFRALDVRRNAIKDSSKAPSQVLDVAVSLAKVADVDRNLDAEDSATEGFQEAIKLLESLKINSEENALEQRRLSVLEFLNGQLSKKQSD